MTRLWMEPIAHEGMEAFRDELRSEILNSERLRVIVLLTIFSVFVAMSLIPVSFISKDLALALQGNETSFVKWRFIILLGLFVYLVTERLLLAQLARTQRAIPAIYRYVTAFIETSGPSAVCFLTAIYTDTSSGIATIPIFFYPLFIVLSALRLNFRLCVFTGAVAALEYFCVAMLYLRKTGTDLPIHLSRTIALLALGVVTGLVALQIKKRIVDSCHIAEERNKIVSMFGEHVSPAVVDQLIAQGTEFHSEKKNVCVMFLDIRNFTGFAEKRSPEEVVNYLETLFEFMIEIVNRNHGIINKFLGDGFMAVFGAPLSNGNDCANAVNASLEMLTRLSVEISEGRVPPTTIGIGLHAGDAVTGNIGSALRREYTVIGDVVNLAARIEKLNKQFGSHMLISDAVLQEARGNCVHGAIPMGHIPVRGREAPIQVYRLG